MPSSQSPESPRIAPAVDLPMRRSAVSAVTGASPRRDQSLRGHASLTGAAEGFPRHHPPAVASSLIEAAGVGFAVMSGCAPRGHPRGGQDVRFLPDKEFRYLRTVPYPSCRHEAGPYLHAPAGQVACPAYGL
jgi:hypothetical protein